MSPHGEHPCPVSLTRSGYPRIIPSFVRKRMMKGDDKTYIWVKLFLSFFSLSKVILVAKRIRSSTFASIVSPPDDIDQVIGLCGELKSLLQPLLNRYLPWLPRVPLNQGMTWDPTWKALPTHHLSGEVLRRRAQRKGPVNIKSLFTALP